MIVKELIEELKKYPEDTKIFTEYRSDDYGITYYFRGNIKNNYLKINNKLFRIVRINGDGTVRAILDEKDDTAIPFNTNTDENPNNLVLLEKSTILNQLNTWIHDNIGEYEDLLVASSFCSDSELVNVKDNKKYSQTYNRIVKNTVTLKCFSTCPFSNLKTCKLSGKVVCTVFASLK